MKQNAQEGKSLLNFKILEAKRKPLKFAEKEKVTYGKLEINRKSEFSKATLGTRTYWNNVFKILKGNCL